MPETPEDKKKKQAASSGGMSAGLLPSMPNSDSGQLPASAAMGDRDNDTIPSYLYFIKAVQEGNMDAAGKAISHVQDVHGAQTATQLAFLGKQMAGSNINDIAKRNVGMETNPQMKRLYATINENPDIINKFQYAMPQKGGLANSLSGL